MNIHFVASSLPKSKLAQDFLIDMYGQAKLEDADIIVSLSGDGMVLRGLHAGFRAGIPVYGMNRGGVGFLTNKYEKDFLIERIKKAQPLKIYPLIMQAIDVRNKICESIAINEVYLLRETHQTAKISVSIGGVVRIEELVCDGVVVSTPIGSTAYNFSSNGPILPLDCNLLSMTATGAFRPRRWPGALISDSSEITFTVLKPLFRPVSVVADYEEFREISHVKIYKCKDQTVTLLLDNVEELGERISREQFASHNDDNT